MHCNERKRAAEESQRVFDLQVKYNLDKLPQRILIEKKDADRIEVVLVMERKSYPYYASTMILFHNLLFIDDGKAPIKWNLEDAIVFMEEDTLMLEIPSENENLELRFTTKLLWKKWAFAFEEEAKKNVAKGFKVKTQRRERIGSAPDVLKSILEVKQRKKRSYSGGTFAALPPTDGPLRTSTDDLRLF